MRSLSQAEKFPLMILTKNLVGTNGVGIGTPLDYPTVPENHGKQEHVLVHFQSDSRDGTVGAAKCLHTYS